MTLFRNRSANQTKQRSVHELFRGGKFEPKFDVNRTCFAKEKQAQFTKMGKIHELFVLALSLVWFAGGILDLGKNYTNGVFGVTLVNFL